MRRQPQVGLQLPLDVAVEQLGQQQRVGVALVDRAAEHRADALEERLVFVLGRAASLEDVAPQAIRGRRRSMSSISALVPMVVIDASR